MQRPQAASAVDGRSDLQTSGATRAARILRRALPISAGRSLKTGLRFTRDQQLLHLERCRPPGRGSPEMLNKPGTPGSMVNRRQPGPCDGRVIRFARRSSMTQIPERKEASAGWAWLNMRAVTTKDAHRSSGAGRSASPGIA
jgi:hypothetical protein